MHVLLIGNFAPDRQESMLRFRRQLAEGLRAQDHEVSTWSPQPRLVRILPRYRYAGLAKYVGYIDKFVLFPRQVRARLQREPHAGVVHIVDHANAIYAPLFVGRAVLATCHDLLQIRAARGEFPQRRVSALGRRYQERILANLARVPRIVTPSTQTARDLQRLARIPSEQMTVIPMGLNHPYRRMPATEARSVLDRLQRERPGIPNGWRSDRRGHVLNVSGAQWYKNRRGLLDIYAELRSLLSPAPRLVLVGKPLAPDLAAQARRLGLHDDIVQLSDVSELELQALYSTAEALLFPSWQEGFGWPVAEAQACGCPVFTSNRAPMTEVGGNAAVYFDPADPAAAARIIATAWLGRTELGGRGLKRASEWDPRRMIERYVDTYHRLCAGAQPVAA